MGIEFIMDLADAEREARKQLDPSLWPDHTYDFIIRERTKIIIYEAEIRKLKQENIELKQENIELKKNRERLILFSISGFRQVSHRLADRHSDQ